MPIRVLRVNKKKKATFFSFMKGKMKMWMDYSGVPECQRIYIDLQWHCMALWTGVPAECIWELDLKKKKKKEK